MKFQCKKCNYMTDKKEMPSRCPYCGEPASMQKARIAQDILDDVTGDPRYREQ
jgi:predicted Zn-ribbon and HTH transcriptional regulator